MLERLFKSKTTVRLLELLLFGKPLHLREIARRIDITPTYVKKELENLRQLGLVTDRKFGNLVVWEMNRASPMYEDMKRIFIKTESIGRYLDEVLGGQDIAFALVYGSFARGDESQKSDIDLLIVGKIDEDKLIQKVSEAEKKLNREINYICWDEEEFKKNAKRRHHLLVNIAKNKIILIRGDGNEFRKIVG